MFEVATGALDSVERGAFRRIPISELGTPRLAGLALTRDSGLFLADIDDRALRYWRFGDTTSRVIAHQGGGPKDVLRLGALTPVGRDSVLTYDPSKRAFSLWSSHGRLREWPLHVAPPLAVLTPLTLDAESGLVVWVKTLGGRAARGILSVDSSFLARLMPGDSTLAQLALFGLDSGFWFARGKVVMAFPLPLRTEVSAVRWQSGIATVRGGEGQITLRTATGAASTQYCVAGNLQVPAPELAVRIHSAYDTLLGSAPAFLERLVPLHLPRLTGSVVDADGALLWLEAPEPSDFARRVLLAIAADGSIRHALIPPQGWTLVAAASAGHFAVFELPPDQDGLRSLVAGALVR